MRAISVVLALAVLSAACTNSPATTNTVPTAPATTGTDTFSSFVARGGSSVHNVAVRQTGTIAVTLTAVTPAGVVGLGVGVPDTSGSGCSLTNSLDASAAVPDPATAATSPQLTVPAGAGVYCVEVYDSGQLGDLGRTFSVTIAHS